MVLGSESPIFALYDDGKAIFQRQEAFKSVELNRFELKRLVKALGLADSYVLVSEQTGHVIKVIVGQ
jgi:hypothetical protein